MPDVSKSEGLTVVDAKGKILGRVSHVLFHPTEPRVVGYEVQPPAIGYVVTRKPRFIQFRQAAIVGDELKLAGGKPPSEKAAQKAQGFEWESSVIWRSMPVLTRDGAAMGFVRDVRFSATDGSVTVLALTGGVTADVAVGTKQLDGAAVVGFDVEREAVIVESEAARAELSGGVAAQAGKSTAVAKLAAEKAAKSAAVGAAVAVRAAAKSDVAKRAVKGWKSLAEAFKEGLEGEDE